MKCSCGVSLSSVLAVVGVLGLGVAGYNVVRTGCPLGSCATTSTGAVLPASDATNKACPASSDCTGGGGKPAADCQEACRHDGDCSDACPRSNKAAPASGGAL